MFTRELQNCLGLSSSFSLPTAPKATAGVRKARVF